MKFRIAEFCALPEKVEYNRQVVFRLGDPEHFSKNLFQSPDQITPNEQRTVVDGVTIAAKSLDCDFVLINPPEYYRAPLEKTLSEDGIIALYPDLGITACGGLHLLRLDPAENLPKGSPTLRLQEAYDEWLSKHFTTLSEEKVALCPDPWRLFVHHVVRGLFQYRIH